MDIASILKAEKVENTTTDTVGDFIINAEEMCKQKYGDIPLTYCSYSDFRKHVERRERQLQRLFKLMQTIT